MKLDFPELDFPINLTGKVDRVDEYNGLTRIIDYKSGFVKPEDVSVSSIEQVFEKPKAAQLLFYGYLYNKDNPNSGAISGIISMRNLKQNLISFSLKEKKGLSANKTLENKRIQIKY